MISKTLFLKLFKYGESEFLKGQKVLQIRALSTVGAGITRQKITRQSSFDWLKIFVEFFVGCPDKKTFFDIICKFY